MQAVNDCAEEDEIELIQSLLPDNSSHVKALLPENGSESKALENKEKNGKTNAPDRSVSTSAKACQCARHLLYVSHAFNQFSEFAWQFSLTIFLAAVVNYQSIVLVSTYGFATQLAVVVACPKLGTWLDHVDTNRLRAARILIGLEMVAVWMTTACCFMLLSSRADASDSHQAAGAKFEDASSTGSTFANVTFDTNQLALLVLIHFFGSVVTVLDQAFTIAMERDWVVNMCRASAEAVAQSGDEAVHDNSDHGCSTQNVAFSAQLSTMNVTMKQIDLSCKVVGPALAGLLLPLITSVSNSQRMTANGLEWGCLFIGGLNTLALVAEYIRTSRIYTLVPALSDKVVEHEHRKHGNDQTDSSSQRTWLDRFTSPELRLYMQQPTALYGFSLAVLYCNG
ncbi:hypothetical protein MPSEU_000657900 [Mayamaea pseudoterrestris]|nr:hypothetical protein MPSEU_000657900 [Mayamaea pseudoterrestris]